MVVEQAVRGDGRVVQVGALAVAVGERAAGLLDDRPSRRRGRTAPARSASTARSMRALGDQHVLPEVAEAAGAVRAAAASATSAPVRPASSQPVGERDATCASSSAATVDTRHGRSVGERRRGRAPPTSDGCERRRRHHADDRPVRRRASARSAWPTPGCRARSWTCRRSGRSPIATANRRRRPAPCSSPNRPSSGRCARRRCGDRRLGLAVGLGDLGVVGLPVEVERSLLVVRQRDRVGDRRPVRAPSARSAARSRSIGHLREVRVGASRAARRCPRRRRGRGS